MDTDLTLSGERLLLGLINEANPHLLFAEGDLSFGTPYALAEDATRNAAIEIRGTGTSTFEGPLTVTYNRLDLTTLFTGDDLQFRYAADLVMVHDLIPLINARFGINILLSDIINAPLNLSGSYPKQQTLIATPDSTIYRGALQVTLTQPAVLVDRAVVWNVGTRSVSVVDRNTRTVLTNIPVTQGGTHIRSNLHDIRLAGSKAYVNWRGGELQEVDLIANTSRLVASGMSDSMGFDVTGGYAYIAGGGTHNLIRVNLADGVKTPVNIGGFPTRAIASPDGAFIYTAGINSPLLLNKVSTASYTVVGQSSEMMGVYKQMTVSPDGSRLYVPAANVIKYVDTSTMAVVGSYSFASGKDVIGMCVSPDGLHLFAVRWNTSNSYYVTKIRLSDNTVVGFTDVLKPWNGQLAVTPDGTQLYCALSDYTSNGVNDDVVVINTADMTIAAQFTVRDGPSGIALGSWYVAA